jgi:hypothetical protein
MSAELQGGNFDAYYEREIAPVLRAREADRRRAVRTFQLAGANGVALAVAILIWRGAVGQIEDVAWFVAAVFAFGGFGIGAAILSSTARGVKDVLLPRVAAFCGARYARVVSDTSAIGRFRAEKLLPSYDRSSLEDEIKGTREGAAYSLFEAHLRDVRRDSKGRTTTVTVFRGQLLRVAFPQKFLGRTIVLRDAGMFNGFLGLGTDLQRVGLVDPKFEKVFEVLSTDQVEARYLLTPVFMERLLKLEELLHGKKARAAFSDGDLLVAIEGGNLFEAGSMFKPLADRARVDRVLKEIQSVHGVIDALLAARAEDRGLSS